MSTLKLYTDVLYTSSIGRIDKYWVVWTIIIFSVSSFMDSINQFLANIHPAVSSPFIQFLVLVFVNSILYRKYSQSKVISGKSQKRRSALNLSPRNKIEMDVMKRLVVKIESFMEKDRPYLDPDITIKGLANKLGMSSRKLSTIINHGFNKNFASFINDYRIEMAKKRFKNPIDEKETICEIMYDVGFNSKSSFNTLFKQKTKYTPSEYKKIYAKKNNKVNRFFQKELTCLFSEKPRLKTT